MSLVKPLPCAEQFGKQEIGDGSRELLVRTVRDKSGDVVVTVGDSGPGLSPDSLARLFDPFYTTKASGMGMGLSICRSIIEAHGGQIWASPRTPRGAVFQFACRVNQAALPSHLASAMPAGRTTR